MFSCLPPKKRGSSLCLYLGKARRIEPNVNKYQLSSSLSLSGLAKYLCDLWDSGRAVYCPQKDASGTHAQPHPNVILVNSRHIPSKCGACNGSVPAVWHGGCSRSSLGLKSQIPAQRKLLCLLFSLFSTCLDIYCLHTDPGWWWAVVRA